MTSYQDRAIGDEFGSEVSGCVNVGTEGLADRLIAYI